MPARKSVSTSEKPNRKPSANPTAVRSRVRRTTRASCAGRRHGVFAAAWQSRRGNQLPPAFTEGSLDTSRKDTVSPSSW